MSEDSQYKSPEERYEDRFTRALGTILRAGTLGVGPGLLQPEDQSLETAQQLIRLFHAARETRLCPILVARGVGLLFHLVQITDSLLFLSLLSEDPVEGERSHLLVCLSGPKHRRPPHPFRA